MPKRNAVAILLAMFLCSLCYSKAMLIRPTEPLADALSLIEHRYVKATDQRELVEAAMHAVVDKLDPYSEYFGPRHAEMFQQELAQSFPGIGVLIDKPKDSARARVVTPLVGSPALRAGILPNDELWSIEGEDVEGWDVEQIRGKLRGPEGTAVSIEVKRESEPKPVPIHVERASIPIDSVVGYQRLEGDVWSYYLPDHSQVAYLRISMFGERTRDEVEAALRTLDNKFETLVIDLRSNPGGLLVAAIEICDFLLDGGTIVETRERGDRLVEQVQATPGTLVSNDKKIVVLVNRDSASASEVMAACLQDQGRAVIGGERSYGKGTIQEVLALESGRSLLKITTARYFSPNGRSIHRDEGATEEAIWGVKPEPNLEVKFSDKEMLRLQEFWARASFPAIARDVKLPAAVVKEDGDAEPQAEPDPGPFTDTQLQKVLDVLSEIGK